MLSSVMLDRDPAMIFAIRALGQSRRLAQKVGVTEQAVSQWKRCPPLRVLDVERASGIPRHVLRPDLYPPPTAEDAATS